MKNYVFLFGKITFFQNVLEASAVNYAERGAEVPGLFHRTIAVWLSSETYAQFLEIKHQQNRGTHLNNK